MKLLPPVSLENIPSLQTRVVLKLRTMRRNVSKYSPSCSFAAVSSPSSTTRSAGYSCDRCRGGGKMRASSVNRAERWQVPSASINCDLERKRGRENEEGQEREGGRERRNREVTPSAAIFSWFVGPNRSPFGTRATLRRRFCIHKYHRYLMFAFDRLRAWRLTKICVGIFGSKNSACNIRVKKDVRRFCFSHGKYKRLIQQDDAK